MNTETTNTKALLHEAAGLFCLRGEGQSMNDAKEPWIKARLKTLDDLRLTWPLAWCWSNPYSKSPFPPADEVVIPYLGKTVWVREKMVDSYEVLYEIKDSGGLIVLLEWIDHFQPDSTVPPSGWEIQKSEQEKGDTWVERFEDRSTIVEDMMIIHG
jgi:hypothetical protein